MNTLVSFLKKAEMVGEYLNGPVEFVKVLSIRVSFNQVKCLEWEFLRSPMELSLKDLLRAIEYLVTQSSKESIIIKETTKTT